MESLKPIIQSYKDQLVSAGCNAQVIHNLEHILNNLKEASVKQETLMDQRGLTTQQRIDKLNELYKLLAPISRIAHIIYADDPAMLAMYALLRPKTSTNSVDYLVVSE